MNRTSKFWRATLWLGAAALVLAVAGMLTFGHAHGNWKYGANERGYAQHQQVQQTYGDRNHNHFQPRNEMRQGDFRNEQRGHREFGAAKIAALIGDLLLLFIGVQLWKRAGRTGKVIGGWVIFITLLPLLMMALFLIIPAAVLYLLWRFYRRRRSVATYQSEFVAEQTYTSSAVDSLDAWEAKTRRELNQKANQKTNQNDNPKEEE
ncbi:hypothetical protein [Tumebacillus flagellatus]|uniref:Uncharacterized protein n=1 Tax=Tumebacillus flagellatus TaxID=1157490 RepID=A0A074LPW6_9BACL|nr:hypothetical protein [Tumebacillus flagellatus]KEO84166.1 hypothetical protein EL26_06785 [Tumebacillus flagellatus]